MTKGEQQENKQDEVLQLRASLGRWTKDRSHITLAENAVNPQQDSRIYQVTEDRGSYKMPLVYNITQKEVLAKVKTMQQMGYKLVTPQFPELKEFFRNGRPITAVDIFHDGVDEIGIEKDERTGIEFLMDTW